MSHRTVIPSFFSYVDQNPLSSGTFLNLFRRTFSTVNLTRNFLLTKKMSVSIPLKKSSTFVILISVPLTLSFPYKLLVVLQAKSTLWFTNDLSLPPTLPSDRTQSGTFHSDGSDPRIPIYRSWPRMEVSLIVCRDSLLVSRLVYPCNPYEYKFPPNSSGS